MNLRKIAPKMSAGATHFVGGGGKFSGWGIYKGCHLRFCNFVHIAKFGDNCFVGGFIKQFNTA
jgi:hypothetical protein